eukprot:4969922-Amphidinium_carterae.3
MLQVGQEFLRELLRPNQAGCAQPYSSEGCWFCWRGRLSPEDETRFVLPKSKALVVVVKVFKECLRGPPGATSRPPWAVAPRTSASSSRSSCGSGGGGNLCSGGTKPASASAATLGVGGPSK